MNIDDTTIKIIVHVMSYTAKDLIFDYQSAISKYTRNGLYSAVWDHRNEMLILTLNANPKIKNILIKRGNLWEFIAVFDSESGRLFILMSQDNLDKKRREYEKTGSSSHYLYSLLHYNIDKNSNEQLELLDSPNTDNEKKREADCEEMLGEYADKVNEVVVASFTYVNQIASKALLNIFDGNYNQVDVIDISDMLLTENKTKSEDTLDNAKRNNNQEEEPLVRLLKK